MRSVSLLAALCLSATAASAAPVQWAVADGGNGHWYELLTASESLAANFSDALATAAGQSHLGLQGYLATITSAAEQAFVDTLNPGGASAWLGGSDAATEGTWQWVTGPEAGTTFWTSQNGTLTYSNWNGGEPNNYTGNSPAGEQGLLGWWSGDRWNDISDNYSRYAVLVEYSPVAAVPVPASLPLLGAGIAGFAALRRRKRA